MWQGGERGGARGCGKMVVKGVEQEGVARSGNGNINVTMQKHCITVL